MGSGYSVPALTQWYIEGSRWYGRAGFNTNKLQYFKPLVATPGRVVAVTGANKGLGFSAAKQLAELGCEVHMICRTESDAIAASDNIKASTSNNNIKYHLCDVSNIAQIKELSRSIQKSCTKLDALILNAGCMPLARSTTAEGKEVIMATALGGFLLVDLLVPILEKSSDPRVVVVSSGGGYTVKAKSSDLDSQSYPTSYDGTLIYAFAKRNQIELTEILQSKLEDRGKLLNDKTKSKISTYCMHPGWAETEGVKSSLPDFYEKNKSTLRSAEQGADTMVYLATSDDSEVKSNLGNFWFDRKVARTNFPLAGTYSSKREQEQLWAATMSYLGGFTNLK